MHHLELKLQQKFFPLVERPGRYAGGELFARIPHKKDLQFALAFPDLYEIGFAYLGFQILYHLANNIPGISCQRVFAPAKDAEALLRTEGLPLFTLEGKTPLGEMNLIGFTLQYELHLSNILNILELAEIPILAVNRNNSHPLILGGGTLTFNPEPYADFFDAFLIGDAEERLPELLLLARNWKGKNVSRTDKLLTLSSLPNLYIPSLYRPALDGAGRFACSEKLHPQAPSSIVSALVPELRPHYYSDHPLVPLIAVEHDRLILEIMRGCSRGCRFCHPGFTHRPVREAAYEHLKELLQWTLKNTGYDEVSLLSLSSADYSQMEQLLLSVDEILPEMNVSLSFPSLRLDAFSEMLASSILSGRKTGLTFAPEAGNDRLRRIINKNLSDDELFQALETASSLGWKSVKLYFMLGLPGETIEDVESIVFLAQKCARMVRSSPRHPLHISLSVFSPKPHTPFQRCAFVGIEEAWRRIEIVRKGLKKPIFKLSFNDPAMTAVETLIARGDRRLAKVVERVFKQGARFEGWSDSFNYALWKEAMEKEGLDWETYLGEIPLHSPLPWDFISTGITEEFLSGEADKALKGESTPDCRDECSNCGLNCTPPPPIPQNVRPVRFKRSVSATARFRFRCKFELDIPAIYISHLEKYRTIERISRRANLPLVFTQGFHPHPKISSGPPLPLGFSSKGEFFDLFFTEEVEDLLNSLNMNSYAGIKFLEVKAIPLEATSLMEEINLFGYQISLEQCNDQLLKLISDWNNHLPVEVYDKKGRVLSVNDYLQKLEIKGKTIIADIGIISGRSIRPDLLLENMGYQTGDFKVCRLGCYKMVNGIKFDPLNLF